MESIFESKRTVRYYANMPELQKPEQTILDILRPELPKMRVLDAGVGAGRTTRVIAPVAKEYVGLDYAEAMVHACRGQFPDFRFVHGDVRDLSRFENGSFDLVFFSYNGIDCMGHDDRLRTLAEFRRVLVEGGLLAFSTHNLAGLRSHFAFSLAHPVRSLRLRLCNPPLDELTTRPWAIVRDGSYGFRGQLYYVGLSEQIRQSQQAGFGSQRMFDREGHEVASSEDLWIYFLVEAC